MFHYNYDLMNKDIYSSINCSC